MRLDLDSNFINTLNKLNLRWMRDRITRTWPQWVSAAKEFAAERAVRRQHRAKKVHCSVFRRMSRFAYQVLQILACERVLMCCDKSKLSEQSRER